jgi:hypothetical protein
MRNVISAHETRRLMCSHDSCPHYMQGRHMRARILSKCSNLGTFGEPYYEHDARAGADMTRC